ncbi:hypothetical protein [Roseibium sp. Sym1]|uniref:hypothetical protein n=1 Tax=Roseibium sp. Sym1 TaxID=3016006 RepID=UPI0022B3CA70|nr:hypothetical protein [Roseibium sp. Sym1]
MNDIFQAIACALGLVTAGLCTIQPEPPSYVVIARTTDGQEFIAGEGDNCRDAWRRAVLPENVAVSICVKSK